MGLCFLAQERLESESTRTVSSSFLPCDFISMTFPVTLFPAFENNNSLSEFLVWASPRLSIYGRVVNIWYYLGFYGSRNVCSTSPITIHMFWFCLAWFSVYAWVPVIVTLKLYN